MKMVRLVLRGRQDRRESKERMGRLVLRAKRGMLVNQAQTVLTVCRVCLVINPHTHTLARTHTNARFHSPVLKVQMMANTYPVRALLVTTDTHY